MTPTLVTPIRLQGLREARKAAGLTQVQLAKKVGVRQATISDLETGETTTINLELLDKICRKLGIEPAGLLVRVPK
ncbi:MAG: helix-turn-helix transcriptional regulator [Gemmatimonadales bacterium]